MSYEIILEEILRDFVKTKPSSIQITSDSFLSDEIIPLNILKGYSKDVLSKDLVQDSDENYYWPTIQIDISLIIDEDHYFLFTVQDKESANINLQYSKMVDGEILKTAIKEDDKSVYIIMKKRILEYKKTLPDSILNVTVEHQFITRPIVMNAAKKVIQEWAKKIPELSNLPIDFIPEF